MNRPRLIINAFTMNTVSHISHGLWRHPADRQADYTNLHMWLDLARLLERGRFDAIFFADTLGVGGSYRGSSDIWFENGLQVPGNDPSVLASGIAAVTDHLGIIYSSSVLQEHPFNFARRASTLDHLTGGRIGWNIVTSPMLNAANNFGHHTLVEHDERYRWAQEYLDVTYKLWEQSWDDDAVLRDAATGIYADPRKIHRIDHHGERYNVAGPHLCEPSPQRTPVLFQAGSSPAGLAFAATHAEAAFIMAPSPQHAATHIARSRQIAANLGNGARVPIHIQGLSFVVGATESEARRREREIDEWISIDALLAHMSRDIGIDLGHADPNDPIDTIDAESLETVRGLISQVIDAAPPGRRPTIADLAQLHGTRTRIVGTPEQIADRLEQWQDAGIGGINVIAHGNPQTWNDFIDHVMPTLRSRGLAQREYSPGTLREKLFGRRPHLPDDHPARRYRHTQGNA
ncbi:MAG: NtaA/DmoA family FMN-dependent monooxygenase [Gordonia sp. (in: high G+C Gram-positive bacteria)]